MHFTHDSRGVSAIVSLVLTSELKDYSYCQIELRFIMAVQAAR